MTQPPRLITDAQTMRALAHPVRLALLEVLQRDGELTATRAAEQLGDSPGNMSWHLQTLAKYGFVEEAGGGKGRSRPWRLVSSSKRFRTNLDELDDPGAVAAGDALLTQVLQRGYEETREWMAARRGFSREWQHAAFLSSSLQYLTPEELSEISEEVSAILSRYNDRGERENRPKGTLPVRLIAQGHPLPPTAAGN
jgi:DNA-binding transcriptional ArsR family regulator